MFLSQIAIRRPVTLLMFYLGVILLGFVSLQHLAVDLLPDIAFPRLSVVTQFSGAAPEEVENLVTIPLEAAISGIPGLRRVESVSQEGLSFLSLEFNWGTNMDMALLHTREKLDAARTTLPQEIENPTIVTVDPQSQPIMIIAVLTQGNLFEVNELAEELIKPRLEQIEGIGSAEVVGGLEREIKVEVNPSLLTLYGLTIEELAQRIDAFNRNLQGGIIRKGQFKYALRVVGQFTNLDEIASIPLRITPNRGIIRLRDVARIIDSFKDRQGTVSFNGQETVALLLRKEAGANTVKVTKLARQVMKEIEKEHPEIKLFVVTEEAKIIEESIRAVQKEIIFGGLLAFLIFYLFLQELGTSLIIFAVIATSVITTFNLLFIRSITLNLMSLGGLALGIGMLDDCAIVVIENIYRHRHLGRDWQEAAAVGANEVGKALSASIFTTIAVFLPVIYIHGVAGQLFRDQALTVTFSLLASLLVSLTLIPMMASRPWARKPPKLELSKDRETLRTWRFPPFPRWKTPFIPFLFFRWLTSVILFTIFAFFSFFFPLLFRFWQKIFIFIFKPARSFLELLFENFNKIYDRLAGIHLCSLTWSLAHKGQVTLITGFIFLGTAWLALNLPRELIPQLKQNSAEIRLRTPVDYSLEETISVVKSLEQKLLQEPNLTQIFAQTGLVGGLEALSPEISLNSAKILIQTKKANDLERLIQQIRSWMLSLPALNFSILKEQSTLAQWLGSGISEIDLRIYGDDLDLMKKEALNLAEKLKGLDGITSIRVDLEEGKPEFLVRLKKEAIEANDLSPEKISNFLVQAVRGRVATSFKEIDKKYDITVRAEEVIREDVENVLNLSFPSPSGLIPLRNLVSYELIRGPAEIRRENQQRMIEIKINLKGRRPSQIFPEIKRLVAEINPGKNIRFSFGKEAEEMRLSFRSLLIALILSIILVYMIMAAQFESLLHPFLIMFTVPLGLAGSIIALALTGQTINLLSLIGIIVSVGIVVNNAIVEIDIINHLRKQGLKLHEAVINGCRLRLRPILMSSLSTIFGLIPLSLGMGGGTDLEKPLGIAISGGLFFSTFLTLILIPCLYEAIEKRRSKGER
ncbi:MAG: efflux RND transporter permease subunit [Candidatus Aminicenantes bacterium]|nr:efflux RND transporter permease subunit [Candidatus Aminicenantes bacterium]